MNAALPLNESERLAALRDYSILDTSPEVAFDRLTALAARLFNVPISLVSLVDQNRQWFKSCYGLDTRETDRQLSFCAHAILMDDVMVVPDATQDPRFVNNSLVTGSTHIRFYAGAPLKTQQGFNLGSFCIMDTAPRQMSEMERATLADLAAMAVDEIELRQAARHNNQMAAIIANLTSAVVITDPNQPDNPIIFTNPGFSSITGYSAEEAKGRNCRFLQGADTDPATVQEMREAIAQQRTFKGVLLNYRKDGTPFWSGLTINPIFNESGQLAHFAGLQNDITERKQAEAALQESEERLRLALDAGHMGIWDWHLTTGEGNRSAGYDQLYGFAPGACADNNACLERVHPEDRPLLNEALHNAVTSGTELSVEYRVVWPDNGVHWLALVGQVKRDENGQAERVSGVIMDITERKRAEEVRAGLAAIVNSSDDAIVGKSLDGVITSWNEGARQLYGYSAEEIIGQPASLLTSPDRPNEEPQLLDKIKRSERVEHYETVRVRKDGRRIDISLVMSPIKDSAGRIIGVSAIARDISERKRIEEALHRAKEVAEQARAEAERANLAKSEFLSRMSHELRTPLNAILGFGQLLEMDTLTPKQQRSVELILKGGHHLLDLINEVLEIARIEAGAMSLSQEPVSIQSTLLESLDFVRNLAAQRKVTITAFDGDLAGLCNVHVQADRQRLKQVLLNLLANAIKYNREGGRVNITCEVMRETRLRLLISDTGPGISADKMTRLFVPFDRLDADQSQVEGTGLGLALSRRLVEAMDGTMGVQSTVGEGSTFWIELPMVESQMQRHARMEEEHPIAPEREDATERIVLYIEDNLSNLELVQQLLERRPSIRLMSAMQGSVGFELARQHRPDLIVLDLHLPDINGDEVLKRLRAEPVTQAAPVIMLSADATPRQIERLLASGAQAYLTKPLNVKKFLEAVDEMLQKPDEEE